MTPKEKAQELFDKMVFQIEWNAPPSSVNGVAKQCTLIAVDEIIESDTQFYYGNYWQEVKQEIEKL